MPRTPPDPADRAFRHAVRLLRVRARSTAELRDRLAAHPSEAVEHALRRLAEARLVDDDALAADLSARDNAQGRSRRSTEARLRARGLTPAAGGRASGEPSDAALALAAARQIARRLPASLPPLARWRRLLGALARLGHEREAAYDAARAVLGDPPTPSDD